MCAVMEEEGDWVVVRLVRECSGVDIGGVLSGSSRVFLLHSTEFGNVS